MKKRFLAVTLLLAISPIWSSFPQSSLRDQCISQLQRNRKTIVEQEKRIQAFVNLVDAEKKAVVVFLNGDGSGTKKMKQTLVYKDGFFYGRVQGRVSRYDIRKNPESKEYEVYEVSQIEVDQTSVFDFQPSLKYPRPFDYFSNVFKFGGVLTYNTSTEEVFPDISLMYEFLSFDKIFGTYGWSLNASLGLTHVGGFLGHQFIRSTYFKNTSLVIGYAYQFRENFHSPVVGIALNF